MLLIQRLIQIAKEKMCLCKY